MKKKINISGFLRSSAGLLVLVICFLATPFSSKAQNVYNDGSSISIGADSKLYMKGSYFHNAGNVDNNGEIHIADSLVNNSATFGVFGDAANRPAAGKVIFDGSGSTQVSGPGMPVVFFDFTLDNALSTFKLFRPFELEGTLTFTAGNIDLNGRFIDLGTHGILSGESNSNRIFGNSGYVTATRLLGASFSGEIAGLGFHIDTGSDNFFGDTEIRRSHFALSPFSSNGNINRFYDFKPTHPGLNPVPAITVNYFSNETLPGHVLSDYKIFHSYSDGEGWIKEESQTGSFYVMATSVNNMGTSASGRSLVTISEGNCNDGPVVDLGPAARDLCEGAAVEIKSSAGQQRYTWKKDGVVISNETTHKITVSEAALYELRVIDANGCEGTDNITINIKQTPVADFQAANFACNGQATHFTDLSTSPDGTLTYAWDFGDPSTTSDVSSDAVPSYTYSGSGLFNATLTVTSSFGCVSTARTNTVTVNALPSVDFSSDQVCHGTPTSFSNNAVAGIAYDWDFGGGNTSDLPAPQFTFNGAGTHSVTLTATDPNTACTKAATKNVIINPNPIADFTVTPDCRPNEILFSNTSVISSGALEYQWDFGDGEVGAVENPFKIYQQAGMYDVVLNVTSSLGCTETITKPVSVSLPVPIFNGDVATCGDQVMLDANADERFMNATFEWSTSATGAQLTVTESGTYTVTVATPDGCETTESVKVTLNTIVLPDFGADLQACGSLVLDAGFYPGGSYSWSTNEMSQSITVTESGNYGVDVTDQNGCTGNASVNVQINPIPVVDLGADQTLCDGQTTQLDAGTEGNTYLWSDGSVDRFFEAGASGQYTVDVTNDFGCSATDDVKVTVLEPLKVDLGPDRVICGGISIMLDAGILNMTAYEWKSASGVMGTSKMQQIENGGKYWVTVESPGGCFASDTILVNETANTLNAEFLSASKVRPGDTVQFINVSYPQPFTSRWDFGNGQTSDQEDASVMYFTEGDFNVSLTVTNGICTDMKTKTISVNIDSPSGRINPPETPKEDIVRARAFPNPTRDHIRLEVELSSEMKVLVRVASLVGVSFFDKTIETQNVDEMIDLTALTPGVYVVVIITENQTKSIRVLKH